MAISVYAYRDHLRRRAWFRFFRAITILIFLVAALFVGFIVGMFQAVSNMLPVTADLAEVTLPQPTRIIAADGTLLAKIQEPDQNREVVELRDMGIFLPMATVAIEDERFYKHPGVDFRGILRALTKNVAARGAKEGASTITQQLARNLYLNRGKTVQRKLEEMVLALELERRYTKYEILDTYLNQVFYGSNPYGLQSWGAQVAAHNYFDKDVKDLTLAEAALLAGLPKNPTGYSPYTNIKAAKERRNIVLGVMQQNRFITQEECEKARAADVSSSLAPPKHPSRIIDANAPYFVDYLLHTELIKELPLSSTGKISAGDPAAQQELDRLIYHAGLVITTSLDPRLQKVAEEAVTNGVNENRYRKISDGCLVAIDPKTGLIKAMVGDTNYADSQFNIVTQGYRQPGSAFKPIVYATAILHGYNPNTNVEDIPVSYPLGNGKYWEPQNSDGSYYGTIPMKEALWLSRNCASARIAHDVGINPIIEMGYRMGIPRNPKHALDPVLATALGASDVLPLDICSCYATLANSGIHQDPTGILCVSTMSGDKLYEYTAHPTRALPADVADTMKTMMRGVIQYGTGRSAECPFPASGKTGTTNSYHDAWFIGFTDDIAAAVWVGNRNNEPMNRTYGATVPAPIWRTFMETAQPIMTKEHGDAGSDIARINNLAETTDVDRSPTKYIAQTSSYGVNDETPPPEEKPATPAPDAPGTPYTVMICPDSGDLATHDCPAPVAITYIHGQDPSPPDKYCTLHHKKPEPTSAVTGTTTPAAAGAGAASGGTSTSSPGKTTTPPPTTAKTGVLVRICVDSGCLATDNCPHVITRRYAPGTAPTATCPLHPE